MPFSKTLARGNRQADRVKANPNSAQCQKVQ